jgi:hypothetical protein
MIDPSVSQLKSTFSELIIVSCIYVLGSSKKTRIVGVSIWYADLRL